MSNKKNKLQEEIRDIMEMVRRFNAANGNKVCFICDLIAFKDAKTKKGEPCWDVKDNANVTMIYGNKYSLRMMLDELRDIIEDEADENDFVNI